MYLQYPNEKDIEALLLKTLTVVGLASLAGAHRRLFDRGKATKVSNVGKESLRETEQRLFE